MKILVLILGISLAAKPGISQTDSSFLNSLQDLIRDSVYKGLVYYTTSVSPSCFEVFKRYYKHQLWGYNRRDKRTDTLKLAASETNYIISKSKDAALFKWENKIIPGFYGIPKDSIGRHIIKKKKELFGEYGENDSLRKLVNYRSYTVFGFSKPIYFRKNTLFIIYYFWYDLGGEEDYMIFRKSNGKWEKWFSAGIGAW